MDAQRAAAALIAVGVLLQALGVIAVVGEIIATRRRLRKYAETPWSGRATNVFGLKDAALGTDRAVVGIPTPEQRLATVEQRVNALSQQVTAEISDVETRLRKELHEEVEAVSETTRVSYADLKELVEQVFNAGGFWRVTGVVLLLAGLLVGAIGGVWSVFILGPN